MPDIDAASPSWDRGQESDSQRAGNARKRNVSRRRFLKWTAATVGVGVLAAAGGVGWAGVTYLRSAINTIGTVDFRRRLAVPPLAGSRVENGTRIFDLTMQSGESDFGRGAMTPTWGINGPSLAPTLRAGQGERVEVRVTNDLPETSTLHWHGMHLPAEMDGGPHQMS